MASNVNQLQSGIRRAPIEPQLETLLNSVGQELGVYFDVTSGGQNDKTGRTGSHRHDNGGAADVKAYTLGGDGSKHYLDQSNPADNAVWQKIIQLSVAGGATGVGAGKDYMGNFTAHIGYGKPSVWGAGGKGVNAPEWIKTAYETGQHLPPGSIPQVGTALDTIDRAFPRPMPSSIASAYAANPRALPPIPQARPANMDAGGFNMAPPNLPLNAPLPPNRGASYGPNTGQWGPKIGQLGTQAIPTSGIAAPTMAETMAEQRGYHPVPTVPAAGPPQVASLAPVPMPGRPGFASPQMSAPIPMPARPASLTGAPPVPSVPQAVSAPVQRNAPPQAPPSVPQVRLASGQMIAPGIYNQGDHSVSVTNDGSGNAKIDIVRGPMAIPGVIDPLREANAPTLAGDMIRKMIPKMATDAMSNFNAPATVDNVKSAAANAASNLGTSLSGFGSGITGAFSGLGGLFGAHPPIPTTGPTLAQLQAIRNVPRNSYYPPIPQSRPFSLLAPRVVQQQQVPPVPVRTPNSVAVLGANDPDRYAQQVFGNPNGGTFGGSLAGF